METSQTVFSGGVMLGALLFPPLSDMYGRKPTHLLSQWLLIIVGFITAFSPSFVFFVVFRFLAGALREVIYNFVTKLNMCFKISSMPREEQC